MSKHSLKIIVDPRSNYAYSSFYLYGLIQKYGIHSISYSIMPFEELPDPGRNLRFIVTSNTIIKVSVHTDDACHIHEKDYQWCDIYGNVNANFTYYPKEKFPKQVSLVPSFAIKAMPTHKALWFALTTYLKAFSSITHREEWSIIKDCYEVDLLKNTKHHFGRIYRTSINRLPYSEYENAEMSIENYVFFLSTLWYNHPDNKNDEGVNLRRAHFIRACKSIPNIDFSGGLLGDSNSSREKFMDVLTGTRVPMAEWIRKTKLSSFVFNTPAFWDCHGWKLGEYLALGKCIISTPLSNNLPYPLLHGEHIHFVEPTQEAINGLSGKILGADSMNL